MFFSLFTKTNGTWSADTLSGLTVALALVPEAIAFSFVAKVDPVVGLWSAVFLLAEDVEWTSKVRGDGAGYDVRSFEGPGDRPLYIEVKSTNAGIYQPFLVSRREVDFSRVNSDSYSLYRLFKLSMNPGVFRLDGAISKNVHMVATQFRASF